MKSLDGIFTSSNEKYFLVAKKDTIISCCKFFVLFDWIIALSDKASNRFLIYDCIDVFIHRHISSYTYGIYHTYIPLSHFPLFLHIYPYIHTEGKVVWRKTLGHH